METFSVDRTATERDSILEKLALFGWPSNPRFTSLEHVLRNLQMLLISFVRNNHIIEDGLGARSMALFQMGGFEVMSKTNRLYLKSPL